MKIQTPYKVTPNKNFINRKTELKLLSELHNREFSKYTFEYALIVGEEISDKTPYEDLFDHVVDLNKLMSPGYLSISMKN